MLIIYIIIYYILLLYVVHAFKKINIYMYTPYSPTFNVTALPY